MKRSHIIWLAVLIAASAALFVLFLVLQDRKNNPVKNDETPKAFTVMTIDVDSVDKIEIHNTYYDAVFEKKDDKWYNDNDLPNPVIFENLVHEFLKNLLALNKIENPADFSEYGLAEPAGTFTAYAGSKELVTIMVGDRVPTKDQYYCRFAGDPNVYLVSSSYAFYMVRERSYYTSRVSLPSISAAKYVTEVTIEGSLFPEFHAVKLMPNPYDYSNKNLFNWVIDKPYRAAVEADTINAPWLAQLEWYLAIYCDDMKVVRPEEFNKYGLSNPAATLTVKYTNEAGTEENSYTLLIGDTTDDGGYYAKLQGLDVLLMMSEGKIRNMCEFDVFANTYATLFFPTYTTFAKVEITTENGSYVFEQIPGEEKNTFLLNGKEVSEDFMSDWSSHTLMLVATAYRPMDTPETDPIMTVRVEVMDKEKNKDSELRFFRGEDGFITVERRGVCDFVIDSRSVDNYINYMKGLQE